MSPKTASSVRGIAALALLCAVAASPAMGQQPADQQKSSEQPQRNHTVRKGDTLWDLAQFYLSDPFRWPMIYEANRSVVENPHWIYPKEKLTIVIPNVPAVKAPVMVADAGPTVQHTRFYTPKHVDDRPTMIVDEAANAPLVQAMEWMAAPRIANRKKLDVNAKVARAADPRVVADKLKPLFHPKDQLFLTMVGKGVKKDDQLLAFRLERDVGNFGWMLVPQGILRVDSIGQNTATATVVEQFADLQLGDLTMPLPALPALPANRLTDVSGGPMGKVIEFLVDQPLYATTDFGFVNLGAKDGVSLGDELLAYVPKRKTGKKETYNEQAVARMRVIFVGERTATVRVTRVSNAVLDKNVAARVVRVAQ